MAPRFEEGELIYVSGRRPARPGDYVVVQMAGAEGEVTAWCKKLVGRDSARLVLEQFNPAGTFDLPMTSTMAVHRVLTLNELFGI
ncbi:MAG: S24 family peptidase [Minwuia sp.]|uniref:S24 family peptidase n=1 Tax=Minwuia sp. TaxID=2493630 RepID=UPI003A852E54